MRHLQPIENHLVADTVHEDNQAQATAEVRICGACGEEDRAATYQQDCRNYICSGCRDGYKDVIDMIKPL